MAVLTPDEVRAFLADSEENNHLLDGVEFTDTRINLAMEMAVDSFNTIPPISATTIGSLRSKSILLYGTLWHLYNGQVGLAARNQMSYSDGGLTIPIEERYQFYIQMAQMYEQQFKSMVNDYKIAMNMESGWGSVHTDYASFPIW